MLAASLQVIDNFLLQYNAGQILLALFIVSTLGLAPLKSAKAVGINVVVFGFIFLVTPSSLAPIQFRFLGIALLFVGPIIVVADIDPVGLDIETYVGGERRQEDNTENMFIKPRSVISFLSERFTFQPGDVISFGSPANPGLVEPGEAIEITYENIGTLSNTVVE